MKRFLVLLFLVPSLVFGQSGWSQPVPVGGGGTGATNADAALTNLGAKVVGKSLLRTEAPAGVRYIRVNADGTITLVTKEELVAELDISSTPAPDTFITSNGDTLVDSTDNTFVSS